jgi:inorganic phosphate transporter, PiT family
VDTGLAIAMLLALVFAGTNGLHDASNAIATLVATRAASPLQAIILASVFNLLGPLAIGAAVADTIGGIVTVAPSVTTEVIGSGLAAAVAWNLATWRYGLPSSSGHALVGGLVGAAIAEGGIHAVRWGGLEGGHPVGVFGRSWSSAACAWRRGGRRAAGALRCAAANGSPRRPSHSVTAPTTRRSRWA